MTWRAVGLEYIARHVIGCLIGCQATQYMRVQSAVDDVASIIHQALPEGISTSKNCGAAGPHILTGPVAVAAGAYTRPHFCST